MIVSRRADAAAICEAVRRPTMRFVRIKSAEQQCQLMQHRTRDLMMRQRTQLINALRAHLAELGIVAAMGDKGFTELLAIVADEGDGRLPAEARATLALLAAQLNALQMLIGSLEKQIRMQHRANPASKRLETIPGIGIIGATAIAATVVDPTVFSIGTRFCGVDRCRGRNRAQASRSLDRSPSEATAICVVFSSSARTPSCDGPCRILGDIPGSRSFWRDDPSRSSRWHLPTRWRAWPGPC
jgi:transposase